MKTIRVTFLGTALFMGFSVGLTNGQLPAAPEYQVQELTREQDTTQATAHLSKAQLDARQKRLVTDTARLLALVSDLKTQVDKSPATNTLSVAEIKKADEIEKLAHSLKQQLSH